jgi:hypothetical protein
MRENRKLHFHDFQINVKKIKHHETVKRTEFL